MQSQNLNKRRSCSLVQSSDQLIIKQNNDHNIQNKNISKRSSLISIASNNPNSMSVINQQSQLNSEINSMLNKIKKSLIQPYKIIRKHIKQNNYQIQQSQLKQVYQNLSQCLKTIQKGIQLVQKYKSNNHNTFINQSILSSQYNYQSMLSQYNNNNNLNNNLNINNYEERICKLSQKIKILEYEMQKIKQNHSQQIRLIIQNHQEEMMFFQQEKQKNNQLQYINQILKELDKIKQKQKQQIIIINNKQKLIHSYLTEIKHNSETITLLQTKMQQNHNLAKQKQQKYKLTIIRLVNNMQLLREENLNLNQQHQQISIKFNQIKEYYKKIFIEKIKKYVKKLQSNDENKQNNQLYLNCVNNKLLAVIQSINKNNNLIQSKSIKKQNKKQTKKQKKKKQKLQIEINQSQFQQSSSSQLFAHNTSQISQSHKNNNFDQIIQQWILKLMYYGFFIQENLSNINNLISLSKNLFKFDNEIYRTDEEFMTCLQNNLIYPLVMDKIRLTIEQYNSQKRRIKQNQQKDQIKKSGNTHQNESSKRRVAGFQQFQSQQQSNLLIKNYKNNRIIYRNIQSIEQLQINDSYCNIINDTINIPLTQQQDKNNNFHKNNMNIINKNMDQLINDISLSSQQLQKQDNADQTEQEEYLQLYYEQMRQQQQVENERSSFQQQQNQNSVSYELDGNL